MKKLFWLAFLLASPAWATTYYVSTTGNNANSCMTAQSPGASARRNIIDGVDCLNSGDTLIVQAGTYTNARDHVDNIYASSFGTNFRNGTSGSRILIKCESHLACTVRPNDGVGPGTYLEQPCCVRMQATDYWTIQDFIFDASGTFSSAVTIGGVGVVVSDNDISGAILQNTAIGQTNELSRNIIHDTYHMQSAAYCGAGAPPCGYGTYLSNCNGCIFDGNTFHHNSGYAFHIFFQGGQEPVNAIIRNNIFHDNNFDRPDTGADAQGEMAIYGSFHKIYNNLFYGTPGRQYFALFTHQASQGDEFYNNTLYNFSVGMELRGTNQTIENNLVINVTTPIQLNSPNGACMGCTIGSGSPLVNHNITTGTATSIFVTPGSDFHLRNGSSAIDTGGTLGIVTTDRDGTSRPQGTAVDVGAYEYTPTLPLVFNFYSPFVIDHTKVPSNQTSFPVWITLTDARFKTVANAGHVQNASAFDIRMSSNNTCTGLLPFQLYSYNAATGAIQLRVSTNLSSSVDTTVYFCYGNSSLTTDGSSSAVWDANYSGVWPLAGTASDVSGNAVNGTLVNAPTLITGQVGDGLTFSSTARSYVDLGNAVNPTAITVEAWVKATSFPNTYNSVVSRVDASFASFADLNITSGGKLAVYVSNTAGGQNYDASGSHTLSTATWYYLSYTYSAATGLIGYVNAASDGTVASDGTNLTTDPTPLQIGNDLPFNTVSTTRNWNGIIDEVKISKIARSANWITTVYNNEGAPNTFGALGAENGVAPPAGTPHVFGPVIFTPKIFRPLVLN